MNPGWPDLVIGGITLFFAWKGFRNGFVAELAGPVAIVVALVAAFWYSGSLDGEAARLFHLGPGSAHAVGTVTFAIMVYAIVTLAAWLLGRIAALPGVALVNRAAGAVTGAAKALLGAWAILYVSLFFPLTGDIRTDLHRSPIVSVLAAPDADVDAVARGFLPSFARPYADPFFGSHHP